MADAVHELHTQDDFSKGFGILNSVPEEIRKQILGKLSGNDRRAYGRVNQDFKETVDDMRAADVDNSVRNPKEAKYDRERIMDGNDTRTRYLLGQNMLGSFKIVIANQEGMDSVERVITNMVGKEGKTPIFQYVVFEETRKNVHAVPPYTIFTDMIDYCRHIRFEDLHYPNNVEAAIACSSSSRLESVEIWPFLLWVEKPDTFEFFLQLLNGNSKYKRLTVHANFRFVSKDMAKTFVNALMKTSLNVRFVNCIFDFPPNGDESFKQYIPSMKKMKFPRNIGFKNVRFDFFPRRW